MHATKQPTDQQNVDRGVHHYIHGCKSRLTIQLIRPHYWNQEAASNDHMLVVEGLRDSKMAALAARNQRGEND